MAVLDTELETYEKNRERLLGEYEGLYVLIHGDEVVGAYESKMDAIRLVAPRKLVVRNGKVVARTEPARATVVWDGREEPVDFLKPIA